MSDVIRLLPDHVANQIAAGEVIQRPASVVKELLENAIDAQASSIKIIIKEAGKGLIQVIDDGVGMSPTDARMSFERHATSKIQQAEDLFALQTKGFRGEALASIASVAQVEMRTMRAEDQVGTCIKIIGTQVDTQEPMAMMKGTDLRVKNLFFNIPARRKFLKSDAAEFKHIMSEYHRVVLAHPDIQFELMHNDRQVSKLLAEGLKRRIIAVLGKKYEDKLLAISEDTEIVQLSGFITTADAAKARRDDAYLFVNGRYFRSPYFHHAISAAYGQLIPDGRHPTYAIFMEIDPERLDINVHPTKQEIKFEDGQVIYNFLRAATRQALAQHHMVPMVDFDPVPAPMQSTGASSHQTAPSHPSIGPQHRPGDWEAMFDRLGDKATPATPRSTEGLFHDMSSPTLGRVIGGWPGHIITQRPDGLLVIDQRSAHIRILFEDLHQRLRAEQGKSQGLVFPETIDLTAAQMEAFNYLTPYLQSMGYDVSPFGQQSIVVHGVPAIQHLAAPDAGELISLLEDELQEMKGSDPPERIATKLAGHMAMRRDRDLSQGERQQLVDQLGRCAYHDRTPHGHRCYTHLSREDLIHRISQK